MDEAFLTKMEKTHFQNQLALTHSLIGERGEKTTECALCQESVGRQCLLTRPWHLGGILQRAQTLTHSPGVSIRQAIAPTPGANHVHSHRGFADPECSGWCENRCLAITHSEACVIVSDGLGARSKSIKPVGDVDAGEAPSFSRPRTHTHSAAGVLWLCY